MWCNGRRNIINIMWCNGRRNIINIMLIIKNPVLVFFCNIVTDSCIWAHKSTPSSDEKKKDRQRVHLWCLFMDNSSDIWNVPPGQKSFFGYAVDICKLIIYNSHESGGVYPWAFFFNTPHNVDYVIFMDYTPCCVCRSKERRGTGCWRSIPSSFLFMGTIKQWGKEAVWAKGQNRLRSRSWM